MLISSNNIMLIIYVMYNPMLSFVIPKSYLYDCMIKLDNKHISTVNFLHDSITYQTTQKSFLNFK